MREDCALGLHAGDPVKRAREMAVGRMRGPAVTVDDPGLYPLERREGRLIQAHHVGRIGKTLEPEPQSGAEAMVLAEGHRPHPGHFERALDCRGDQRGLIERGTSSRIRWTEDVT